MGIFWRYPIRLDERRRRARKSRQGPRELVGSSHYDGRQEESPRTFLLHQPWEGNWWPGRIASFFRNAPGPLREAGGGKTARPPSDSRPRARTEDYSAAAADPTAAQSPDHGPGQARSRAVGILGRQHAAAAGKTRPQAAPTPRSRGQGARRRRCPWKRPASGGDRAGGPPPLLRALRRHPSPTWPRGPRTQRGRPFGQRPSS